MKKSLAFAVIHQLEFITHQVSASMVAGSIQQEDEVNVEEAKELAIDRMVKSFVTAKHAERIWMDECINLRLMFGCEIEDIQKFIKERHKNVQGV